MMTRFIRTRFSLLSMIAALAPVQGSTTLEAPHERDRIPPIAPEFQVPRGFVPKPEKKTKKFTDPHRYQKQRHTGKSRRR